jgi:hypothetical protein
VSARVVESARRVRMPGGGLISVGQLAGTTAHHPHVPDGNTGSLCLACYGWADDHRHLTTAAMATSGIGGRPAGRHA